VNVSYHCSACQALVHKEFDASARTITCPHCQQSIGLAEGALDGQRITRCLVCPSTDLFIRKDFPQRIGVGLVVIGILGSCVAWYHANLLWTFGILFATALADVLLYAVVGNVLMCYRCNALYRDVASLDSHGQFDLETHEKYRQLAARMKTIPAEITPSAPG